MSVDGKSAQPSSTVKPTTCLVNLPVHTPPLVHRIQPWEECGFTSSTARDYASVVQILRAAGLSETVQPIVIAGILGRIRGQVNESTDLAPFGWMDGNACNISSHPASGSTVNGCIRDRCRFFRYCRPNHICRQ